MARRNKWTSGDIGKSVSLGDGNELEGGGAVERSVERGNGGSTVDPAAIDLDTDATAIDEPGTRKRRGRRPGSGTKKTSHAVNPDGIELILFNMHAMLAAALSEPLLALEQSEAKMLAEATAKVAEHYQFSAGKYACWTNLAMVAGSIYGPRLFGAYLRKQSKKETK